MVNTAPVKAGGTLYVLKPSEEGDGDEPDAKRANFEKGNDKGKCSNYSNSTKGKGKRRRPYVTISYLPMSLFEPRYIYESLYAESC